MLTDPASNLVNFAGHSSRRRCKTYCQRAACINRPLQAIRFRRNTRNSPATFRRGTIGQVRSALSSTPSVESEVTRTFTTGIFPLDDAPGRKEQPLRPGALRLAVIVFCRSRSDTARAIAPPEHLHLLQAAQHAGWLHRSYSNISRGTNDRSIFGASKRSSW